MARMNDGVLPQRPEFEVTVSTEDGVRVVAVSGDLDLDTMGELNAALAADDAVLATTVLDLRGLTFIDSSGVSGVLAAARRARDAGGRLVCVPGPPSIRRGFELTGIDTGGEWVDGPGGVAGAGPVWGRGGYGGRDHAALEGRVDRRRRRGGRCRARGVVDGAGLPLGRAPRCAADLGAHRLLRSAPAPAARDRA